MAITSHAQATKILAEQAAKKAAKTTVKVDEKATVEEPKTEGKGK